MHRIDDPSAVTAIPTPLQPGTPGYFTDGSPTIGEEATIVRADWANAVQEELAYVIEQSGLVLSKTDRTQLFQAIARLTRQRLTAPITFYVSPAGNDASDGLTQGTAWASISHAYNYIRDRIDLNGFQATIQLADGTHASASLQFPCVGPAPIIQGDLADPSRVTVNGVSVPALTVSGGAVVVCLDFTVTATGPEGDYGAVGAGFLAGSGGTIIHRNMNFGACTTAHMFASPGGGISVGQTGVLYNILGAAESHLYSTGGFIGIADAHISIAGTPNFTQGFANCGQAGLMHTWGCTFTGGAAGPRYQVWGNGIIETQNAGANYFPGDAPGIPSTGGQYL